MGLSFGTYLQRAVDVDNRDQADVNNYQESAIEALRKEIKKLQQENIRLQFQLGSSFEEGTMATPVRCGECEVNTADYVLVNGEVKQVLCRPDFEEIVCDLLTQNTTVVFTKLPAENGLEQYQVHREEEK